MAESRRAAFVAIGSELLRTDRLDTNSLLAARLLQRCGLWLAEKRTVEDTVEAIATAIGELAPRCDVIIVSGGLGPTADDVTREAVALAFGRQLQRSESILRLLRQRYEARHRVMPDIAIKMADVIEGAEVLPNPLGTAPGQLVVHNGCRIAILPGVPREFEEIFIAHLLHKLAGEDRVVVRSLRLASVYESFVEQRVAHLYEKFGRDRVTILGGKAQVTLILTASGADAEAIVAEMDSAFSAIVGADLYGRDDQTLPSVVIERLRSHALHLATAESCTGGLVGSVLTNVPGASDVYVGGVVAYSNQLKEKLLGVPEALLKTHGAVSDIVAHAMAVGACGLGAECGIGVTGIAGPGGGSEEKPIGTVHIVVKTPRGSQHILQRFPGDRMMVREFATTFALDLLRRELEEM